MPAQIATEPPHARGVQRRLLGGRTGARKHLMVDLAYGLATGAARRAPPAVLHRRAQPPVEAGIASAGVQRRGLLEEHHDHVVHQILAGRLVRPRQVSRARHEPGPEPLEQSPGRHAIAGKVLMQKGDERVADAARAGRGVHARHRRGAARRRDWNAKIFCASIEARSRPATAAWPAPPRLDF